MSEKAEQVVVKKVAAAVKKPRTKPNHPPTAEMVDAAIGTLKERGGSSVLAIKKFVAATYKVDVEKLAPFIKKYIKGAVIKGHLLQTKGKGASGSFKLSVKPKSVKPKKTTAAAAKPKAAKKQPAGEKKTETSAAAKKDIKVKVSGTKRSGTVVKAKPAPAAKPKKAAPAPKIAAPKAKKPAAKKVSAKK